MTDKTKKIINKLPKKSDNKTYSVIVGAIIIIAIVIIVICATTQRTYNSYNVIKSKPRTDSMTKGYIEHKQLNFKVVVGKTEDEMARITTENAKRFFGIK